MNPHIPNRPVLQRAGYSLMEVLVAAVLISGAMLALVSMTATMNAQEELGWRTAVAVNHEETAARLWQMGLSPLEIGRIMPGVAGNRMLNEAMTAAVVTSAAVESAKTNLSAMEEATSSVTIENYANAIAAGQDGNTLSYTLFRPAIRGARNSTSEP